MPGFDGTGPRGQGPLTGGGRGYCAVSLSGDRPIYTARRFFRKGQRGGFQRGMQAFGSFGRVVSKEEESEILKSQADFLKRQLEDTQARIQEMEG